MNQSQLFEIISEAQQAAQEASTKFFNEVLKGEDQFPCGFAWVEIEAFEGTKIKGNTRVGKMLKTLNIKQDYNRVFRIWNPANVFCQNVDTLYAGAEAAAEVLRRNGFEANADQRWD